MTPTDSEAPTARRAAEAAARAILEGDLISLNESLHPGAVAEITALARAGTPHPTPDIDSYTIRERAPDHAGPVFDIIFTGQGALARMQISVAKSAGGWRIRRVRRVDPARRSIT
ncbi:MAG: hypothetical protein ACE5EF_13425 [Dehalococcoidia bacterium]